MVEPVDAGPPELEDIEIQLLLEALYRYRGFDYRNYAASSLRRRISYAMKMEGVTTVSALQDRALHDVDAMERLLTSLSIKVTSMFRDPAFFVAFRAKVVPILKTYPFLRIWHAGCSTGEEVYSTAILLEEEGLYDRCRIYATDLNKSLVSSAQTGIFPLASMKEYSTNYLKAGGKASLSEFFTAKYDNAIFCSSLRRNLVFAQHDLALDSSFNSFHVILCRNVMIYFNPALRDRVLGLLNDSLVMFGVLGLGNRESLRFTPFETCYDELDADNRLYRKKPGNPTPPASSPVKR